MSDIPKAVRGPATTSARLAAFIDIVGVWLSPVLLGLSGAFLLAPDANWDLANYHYYNAWAFLNHRLGYDIFPAGVQSYFNPVLDMPFYWGNSHLPGRVVSFCLALVQGTCISAVYLLARRLLFPRVLARDALGALAIAFVGITGVVSLSEIGTVFYDYVGAVGLTFCFLLLASPANKTPLDRMSWRVFLAGFVLGSAFALKEANAYLVVGVTLALPLLGRPRWGTAAATAAFLAGEVCGALVFGGYWAWVLWQRFSNPVFPYFNTFFRSPFAPAANIFEMPFGPHGWVDWLFFPFVFFWDPFRVSHIALRDPRVLLLFLAVPLGILLLGVTRPSAESADHRARRRFLRFCLGALGLSYVFWMALFSVQRYTMALEIMAPLVCALVAAELPWRRLRVPVGALILAVMLTTFSVVNWGRGDWHVFNGRIVDAAMPDLGQTGGDLVVLRTRPSAFVAPFFAAGTRFIQIAAVYAPNWEVRLFNVSPACLIRDYPGRIFIVTDEHMIRAFDTKPLALGSLGLTMAPSECRVIQSTARPDGPLQLCPAHRVAAPAKC
ncbi:MAG TPA: hypothetical protein VID77_13485 [Stellaceae bacterium]|jgi:hypothetical protein